MALDDPAKLPQHPPVVGADSENNLQDLMLRRNRKLAEYLKLDDIVKPRDPPWWDYWKAIEIQLDMNARRIPDNAQDARIIIRCEMPLSMNKDCFDCVQSGKFINCERHMMPCNAADIFLGCDNCPRFLCGEHMLTCYCHRIVADPPLSKYKGNRVKRPSRSTSRHR